MNGLVGFALFCRLLRLIVRADDEPVDPKRELEDRCKAPCTRPLKEYQACSKRIDGDDSGHNHCTGQYFIGAKSNRISLFCLILEPEEHERLAQRDRPMMESSTAGKAKKKISEPENLSTDDIAKAGMERYSKAQNSKSRHQSACGQTAVFRHANLWALSPSLETLKIFSPDVGVAVLRRRAPPAGCHGKRNGCVDGVRRRGEV
ncbi:UNVERIFIED_CONTAM: Cytochrome b-c1 complex subunit-1, mitochondrial [Sesamum calycinum]|uniref:Complex III subunit VI n=1 Tax=Sesamum calycinum TaxID=2727403 RepID=A0AAW2R914_9LAMI